MPKRGRGRAPFRGLLCRGHARLAASQCEREAKLAASREQLDELDRELQSRAQAQDGIPILARVAVFPATRVHSFSSQALKMASFILVKRHFGHFVVSGETSTGAAQLIRLAAGCTAQGPARQ